MSVGRSSLIIATGTVVSRVLGFISAVVLARTLGLVGSGADAFALANHLPNALYSIVAGGVLTAVLVPHIVHSQELAADGERYVNKLITIGLLFFATIATVATFSAPLLVRLYSQQSVSTDSPGFGPAEIQLATAFAWWCLPQIFFYSMFSLLSEVLNARGVYGPATWAPIANNIIAILGTLFLGRIFVGQFSNPESWGFHEISTLGGTATLGVAVQAGLLLVALKFSGFSYRPDFKFRGFGLRSVGKDAAWTFALVLVWQIAVIVQSNVASLASGSGDPGIAILRYGWLIFMLPHSVITISMITPYFTRLSSSARRGDQSTFSMDLRKAIQQSSFFLVLATIVLIVVAPYISQVFDFQSSEPLTLIVRIYMLGLVPYGIQFLLQRALYALGDSRSPFWAQVAQTVIFCIGAIVAASGGTPVIAQGLAIAMTTAIWLQAFIVGVLLHKRVGSFFDTSETRSIMFYFIAAFPASVAGLLCENAIAGVLPNSFGTSIFLSVVISVMLSAIIAMIYFFVLVAFREVLARALLATLIGWTKRSP